MSDWTDSEIRELVRLWPKASAKHIAERLQRPRSSVSGMATRLRRDGVLLPPGGEKRIAANPWQARARAEPPRANHTVDTLAMRPCTLVELADSQCHWPLADMHQVAVLFWAATQCRGGDIARTICGWRRDRGGPESAQRRSRRT